MPHLHKTLPWIRTLALSVPLLALLILTRGFTSIPTTYYMSGPSMAPTIGAGGLFLARPLDRLPARGELVVMEIWLDDTLYHVLRRAVGQPGDTVAMTRGVLRVNSRTPDWPARILEPRAERTLDGAIPGTIYNWGPVVVGRDSVFLLADTRDMLGWPDSRWLGPIPAERVVERLVCILKPGV